MHGVDRKTTKKRLFKLVILGSDPALQAGYLNMVTGANFSYQLYNTLNICIGVLNVKKDDTYISLQMWSLPLVERFRGLTKSFMRGHHAAIIVLRPNDLKNIDSILEIVPQHTIDRTLFVLVTNDTNISHMVENLERKIDHVDELGPKPSVIDTVLALVGRLHTIDTEQTEPAVTVIPTSSCPPLDNPILPSAQHKNSPEEIREIIELAKNLRAEIDEKKKYIFFNYQLGRVQLNAETGIVMFYPHACEICKESCKRQVKLCIVIAGAGWTNTTFSPGALFTMSKLYAFANNQIPADVESQMYRTAKCSKFNPIENVDEDLKMMVMPSRYRQKRAPLIDAALQRVRSGRLTLEAFNILKRKLRIAQRE